MARDFSVQSLVSLPRMTADGCSAIATKCVTVGRATKALKGDARDALEELAEANGTLRRALAARLRALSATREDTAGADLTLDHAWGAFYAWLDGWRGCRANKQREAVATLFAQIFSDGRTFLALPFEQEWAASSTRLALLAQPAARSLVHELGGEPFLRDLRDAHDEYGRVLGITVAAAPKADEDPAVRDAYDDTLLAMRRYVLAVSVVGTRMKSGGDAFVAKLLAPLSESSSTAERDARDDDDAPAKPSPAPTPKP